MNSPEAPLSRIKRVRHETRRRTLTVKRRVQLSPSLLRLTFSSPDLVGFTSLGFDDHIKLFFQNEDVSAARDYTPRRYDPVADELDIEFAIHHEAGPATAWAKSAHLGSTLEIGGPRGSFVVEDSFDWYVLMGDDTALPAIARRLEELRPSVPAIVVVQVDSKEDEISLSGSAALTLHWLHGSAGKSAADVAREIPLPEGEGFVWIAGESAWAKSLRAIFVEERGHPSNHIRAAAYWRRGDAGVHEVIDTAS